MIMESICFTNEEQAFSKQKKIEIYKLFFEIYKLFFTIYKIFFKI